MNMDNKTLELDKQNLKSVLNKDLDIFLEKKLTITFHKKNDVTVSIILVLWNQAELTLSCLKSLAKSFYVDFEIIIIDNASHDRTYELLKLIHGIKVIYNNDNIGFLRAVNQGARLANGKLLLLLNNDATVDPDTIGHAVAKIESDSNIGAVGAKVILPNGLLQEAGNIIWKDGSCNGYLRGQDPNCNEAMFEREVDYCSGVFLLTRINLFHELGGLDDIYAPAYYEETDYCAKLQSNNYSIIYSPKVVIHHYEFGSAIQNNWAIKQMEINHKVFKERHKKLLESKFSISDGLGYLRARHCNKQPKILFFDDTVPYINKGAGYPRAVSILNTLVANNFFITLYPLADYSSLKPEDVHKDISPKIEVMLNKGPTFVEEFLETRRSYYDIIIISRPTNMGFIAPLICKLGLSGKVKIVYDAEAIWAYRDIIYQESILGKQLSSEQKNTLINNEINLASVCNSVITVNNYEADRFLINGYKNVFVVGHKCALMVTENQFENRSNILFVGRMYEDNTPNVDSIIWFIKNVLPLVLEKISNVKLICVGLISEQVKRKIYNSVNDKVKHCIQITGQINDIKDFYNCARVFIAPTRYSAGIPHKCHEAASFGIPIVCSSLIAKQLSWDDKSELLAASNHIQFANKVILLYQDKVIWNTIRTNAINKVKSDLSTEKFDQQLLRSVIDVAIDNLSNPTAFANYIIKPTNIGNESTVIYALKNRKLIHLLRNTMQIIRKFKAYFVG